MFISLLDQSILKLTLGARGHAKLVSHQVQDIKKVFRRDNWSCHVCGIRIPEFMEIDHTKGHSVQSGGLKTICQFCHNTDHLLWAAARQRVTVIHAPEFNQSQLNRIAWSIFALRGKQTREDVDPNDILESVEARERTVRDTLEIRSLEGFCESIIAYGRRYGRDAARDIAMTLDQTVRFWPSELSRDMSHVPTSGRLSLWSRGGFRKAVKTGESLILEHNAVDVGKALAVAEQSLKEKKDHSPAGASA